MLFDAAVTQEGGQAARYWLEGAGEAERAHPRKTGDWRRS